MGKKNKIEVYYAIPLIAIIAALYAMFTYGIASIHSDSASTMRFFNSICDHQQIYPSTWSTANGETYSFHITMVSLITFLIMGTNPIARVTASVIAVSFSWWCLFYFAKKFLKNDSWILSIPIITLFLCSNNARDVLLYFSAYIFQLITLTGVFHLSYRIIIDGNQSAKLMVLHIIIMLLMAIDGVRYFAEYAVPFTAFLFLYSIITLKTMSKKDIKNLLLKSVIFGTIPLAIGHIIYRIICHTHNMNNTGAGSLIFINSFDDLLLNFKSTCMLFAEIFGYSSTNSIWINFVASLLAILLCFIIPIFQLIELRKADKYERCYITFGAIHNAMMLGVIIFTGKLQQRYILSSVFVFAIISSSYIWKKILFSIQIKAMLLSIFSLLTLVFSVNLVMSTANWKDIYNSEKLVCSELKERGITKGYASYFNAYTYEIYSNNEIRFGAVHLSPRQLQKQYWLSDENAFEPIEGNSCIILDQYENDNFSYAINLLIGPSIETFSIENAYVYDPFKDCYVQTNLMVYVFDSDVGDKLTDGLWDNLCDIWEMDFNWIGTMTTESIILYQGGLVHGPYSYLAEGDYRINFEGKGLVGCDVSAVSENTPEYITQTVTSIEDDCIEMIVNLDVAVDDIQFYLYNSMPNTEVIFYDVKVEKID